MGFYDLSKEERKALVNSMKKEIIHDLKDSKTDIILEYSGSADVYIRKKVSQILGRTYQDLVFQRENILNMIKKLIAHENENTRQTSVYTLGEIGTRDALVVFDLLENALQDPHHKVRNAVMSSLKIMGEKNPQPTLKFSEKFLNDPDPEIRKRIIHGIELRGRTHPEDILPLLRKTQYEDNPRVRKMIIHVLGQISYKEGCLEKVAAELQNWGNKALVKETIPYILEVHKKYPFSAKSPEEAEQYLKNHLIENYVN